MDQISSLIFSSYFYLSIGVSPFHKELFFCVDDVRCPVMLDAPVSGGVPGAESGTLTFMVPNPGKISIHLSIICFIR